MPRISSFFGITIAMYYDDHPPPHFHIEYAGHEASMLIGTLDFYAGKLPRRVHALVLEWAALHRSELYANWQKARRGLPLDDIEPLE
jgi:hypothetical protein